MGAPCRWVYCVDGCTVWAGVPHVCVPHVCVVLCMDGFVCGVYHVGGCTTCGCVCYVLVCVLCVVCAMCGRARSVCSNGCVLYTLYEGALWVSYML